MSKDKPTFSQPPGFASFVPKPWVQDLYPNDAKQPPCGLLNESSENLATADIPAERYWSQEWHSMEVDQVWKKTWQVACRVEEIPNDGDYVVYDIVDDSIIVVRSSTGDINAFTNSCLHRGTSIVEGVGSVQAFRCPYHGWSYNLDGKLTSLPASWDFSHLNIQELRLPTVKVDTWAGFVFINLDSECCTLNEYLGVLPEHLNDFNINNRYKAVHVSKVVPCNWKVAQEAFIEGYHVAETHFEKTLEGEIAVSGAAVSNYDTSIQYDYWKPHVTRMNMLGGIPSGHVSDQLQSEQAIVDAYFERKPGQTVALTEGQTARSLIAEHNRKVWGKDHKVDLSTASDAEMIDQIQYTLFPNFTVWPTIVAPLVYRFRPDGNNPNRSIFEIWMLFPIADDGSHPTPMAELRLEDDQLWSSVPELGGYGPVIDQDTPNFPRIQKGLKASKKGAVSLANYQESRIRAFHETLEKYLFGPDSSLQ